MLVYVFYGDEGLCRVVPVVNTSQPSFFGRKICSSMKVLHHPLDDWQFVDVVDDICDQYPIGCG